MTRILLIEYLDLRADALQGLGGDTSRLTIDVAADLDAARQRLDSADYAAVLLYFDGRNPACRSQLDALLARRADMPVICVVADGDHESASEVTLKTSADFVFAEQLDSEHAATILRAAVDRAAARAREATLQKELERRNSELLGINALTSAVSSSLSAEVIIRRALWVFGGLCERGAAALLEIRPMPALDDHEALDADNFSVVCVGEFAVDSQPVCGSEFDDAYWIDLIHDDEIEVLDQPWQAKCPNGFESIWQRNDGGAVVMVPVWGQGRPLGALVLVDLAAGADALPFTREALRAMASQLGAALENARLFAEINTAYQSLQNTQDQLVHAEKFAAMGVLAAEIAHEINNPASFVISNLSVLVDYIETIGAFIRQTKRRIEEQAPEVLESIERLEKVHEIGFLREDLDILLTRSLGGMQRIHQIVQDLRFFSHDTANEPGWVNVESLLEATLNLARHEAKYRASIEVDFGRVPEIFSDANRLSQVFLNLLVNAAHAIDTGTVDDNKIVVRTEREGGVVVVTIRDTGKGIDQEDLPHIFDPFFTTKEQGQGTGLGLSISRDIVRSLGGKITVSSQPGNGSTFQVALPIRAKQFESDDDIRDSGSYQTPPAKLLEELEATDKAAEEES